MMNARTVSALLFVVGCAVNAVPQSSTHPTLHASLPQASGNSLPSALSAPTPSAIATTEDAGNALSSAAGAESHPQESRPADPPGETMAQAIAESLRKPPASGQESSALRPAEDKGSLVQPASAEGPQFARSHDAKHLAFVRVEGVSSALWIADIDGAHARLIFDARTGRAKFPEGNTEVLPSTAITNLLFSRDDRGLFFQTDGSATSLALYRLDFLTKQVMYVTDANGYSVIDECPKHRSLEGKLIAFRHSYSTLLVSAIDLYFLVDGSGKVQGVVGPEPQNVVRFLQIQCDGAKPALPEVPSIPAQLKQLPACGRGNVLRYDPIHYLDGTLLPIFYVVNRSSARVPLKRLNLDTLVSGPVFLEDVSKGLEALCGN